MANEDPVFKIPREVIEPIIQAHISTAITGALSGYQNLVEKTVAYVLNQKVDERGKPSDYRDAVSFIDWALKDSIQSAAKELLQEALAKHKDVLADQIKKELQKKNSTMVKQLAESMAGAITKVPNWNIKFEMVIPDKY